mgnify:CR=1 FL=1
MNDFDERIVVELLIVARAVRTALDVAICADDDTANADAATAAHRLVVAVARLDRAAVALLRTCAVDESRSDEQLELF